MGGSTGLFGDGAAIADSIRERIRLELSLTVSIGVSFIKVFAKLGSDYKKPDATTVITKDNYRQLVWSLPVSDLLYVGPATTAKLARYGITTIGDLAVMDIQTLYRMLGKVGAMLHRFANGPDNSGVAAYTAMPLVKTVGNSSTVPRDLISDDDVKITLYALCESVATRLREQNTLCNTIQLSLRNTFLFRYSCQQKLPIPAYNSTTIFETAFALYKSHRPPRPVRSISVRASDLTPADDGVQLSLFGDEARSLRHTDLEQAVDKVRAKYGYGSIRRGIMLTDPLLDLDAKSEHIIHPIGFLGTLNRAWWRKIQSR